MKTSSYILFPYESVSRKLDLTQGGSIFYFVSFPALYEPPHPCSHSKYYFSVSEYVLAEHCAQYTAVNMSDFECVLWYYCCLLTTAILCLHVVRRVSWGLIRITEQLVTTLNLKHVKTPFFFIIVFFLYIQKRLMSMPFSIWSHLFILPLPSQTIRPHNGSPPGTVYFAPSAGWWRPDRPSVHLLIATIKVLNPPLWPYWCCSSGDTHLSPLMRAPSLMKERLGRG